jgi:hypothetical protein
MLVVKLTIHGTGMGTRWLTRKETDGLAVSFEEGVVRGSFLSLRAFRRLLGLKTGQARGTAPAATGGGSVPVKREGV